MKILLVSGSANFSTRDVWDGFRIGLEMSDAEIIPYPTFSLLKVLSVDQVCSDIIGTALDLENKVDLVVFVDGLFFRGPKARVPRSIRRAGIPTVLIATDDPYVDIKDAESLYTYRFTNEINCSSKEVQYLPTATMVLHDFPRNENPKYQLSFMGSVFEDRVPLLLEIAKYCEEKQYRFLLAGKLLGGEEEFEKLDHTELRLRTIDEAEKLEIYSQSAVTVNLFRKSDTRADSPSPRVFEVTGLGQAALLTGPSRSEVSRIYGDSVYHFDDVDSAINAIEDALSDKDKRNANIERAREITLKEHSYEHRTTVLLDSLIKAEKRSTNFDKAEEKLAWIIGCGRTGSTWLAELLDDLPGINSWHEPYYGRFLRHLQDKPDELQRATSFFSYSKQKLWFSGLNDIFFKLALDRYPNFGRQALFVKEVNTPELNRWIGHIFPSSGLIFLVRDPLDVLDSYLDLQKPGSWNEKFGEEMKESPKERAIKSMRHIRQSLNLSLEAYREFPEKQRLWMTYEELLSNPVESILRCGELLSMEISPDDATRVAEKHQFKNYKKTGTLEFRRKGKAGVWRESENFTPEVLEQAMKILGPLREDLGYGKD